MLSFDPFPDGLAIVDQIERRRVTFAASTALPPTPADATRFRFPVDRAVRVETDELVLDTTVDAFVRDAAGDPVLEVVPGTDERLPDGVYGVELNAAIKVYLRAEGTLSVRANADRIAFEFDPPEVLVGARSYHQHPAATITTSDDPADVFVALSTLSSSLKTTTCERSYPTLRGHPPIVELGDELDVPPEVSRPETGVRLELPPTLRSAYVAAPLGYYLGAELVPADDARLVVDGFERPLGEGRAFERAVERTLKRVVLLDCLTRTEGYYRVDLYERERAALDLDFAALYDRPIADQLPAYLSVPYGAVEPHVPRWPLTAHVAPTPERVEAIPFVVNHLGVVRSPTARLATHDDVRSSVLESFLDGPTRGDAAEGSRFVLPEPTDSVEQAWFAEHVPFRGTKALARAYRNNLDREPDADPIDIAVVCNEREMASEETVAEEVYGSREELPFEVTLHRDLSTGALRSVLESDADFLHYVGHVDADGFRCRDGPLDATGLESVGVRAFVLNACRTYEQGMALVEAGSVGGVVTFSDVVSGGATAVGYAMARLLNLGFPLRAALEIAGRESVVGGHYLVVGDGSTDVVQVEDGVPTLCVVETRDDGAYDVTPYTYPSREGKVGTMAYSFIESSDHHFLTPGPLRTFRLAEDELRRYLTWHGSPVKVDGELVWDRDPL